MVDFPDRIVTRIEFAFGADPDGDPDTWDWTDVTSRRQAQSISITYGRQNEGATVQTASITVTLDNLDGDLTPDNPSSVHYPDVVEGTPMRFSLQWEDTWYGRFFGETTSWEPDWPHGDLSNETTGYQGEARVVVTAAGRIQRLDQGSKPLKDALRRHIEASGPLLYWTLTDGQDARQGSEVIEGAQPVRAVGEAGSFFQGQPAWGQGTLAPWHEPVVQLAANTEGRLSVRVQPRDLTAWAADHYRAGPGGAPDDFTVFDTGAGTDADPLVGWLVEADRTANAVELLVLSAGETTSSIASLTTISDPGIFDLSPHMLRLTAVANGASTDWTLIIDGQTAGSGTYAIPHRPVSRLRYRWGAFASMAEPLALGHIVYWGESVPSAAATWRAVQGHARELAGRRIERLCAEQGVPLLVNGNLDQTPPMGAQKPGALLELLQVAATVDGGVLYEQRDGPGLAYRTLKSKYNQGA